MPIDFSHGKTENATTNFWEGPDPKIRWQDFRWCPQCQEREITKESEMCQTCANEKRANEYWAIQDQIRLVRHMIHVWWTSGEQK